MTCHCTEKMCVACPREFPESARFLQQSSEGFGVFGELDKVDAWLKTETC